MKNEGTKIFCQLPCLSGNERVFTAETFAKTAFPGADARRLTEFVYKFFNYNKINLSFLGVTHEINGIDKDFSVSFSTTSYIGAIPLRASDTGKQIGDFVVFPRFIQQNKFEEYSQLINTLAIEIKPEVIDSQPLISKHVFQPPVYLEIIHFVAALEILIREPWNKFESLSTNSDTPKGVINWKKYVDKSFNPSKQIKFPTKINNLSKFHSEFAQLKYVFDLCAQIISAPQTPVRVKNQIQSRILILQNKLYNIQPEKTDKIIIRRFDNERIVTCKASANKILNNDLLFGTAWRIDFSLVFEKYVQYVFGLVAKEIGGRVVNNPKIRLSNSLPFQWGLKHLEPDTIYFREEIILYIDAKYKSNLYNWETSSELIKEESRKDLHQILAYISFSNSVNKFGSLCYPSNDFIVKELYYKNSYTDSHVKIFIYGLPLSPSQTSITKDKIKNHILSIVNNI